MFLRSKRVLAALTAALILSSAGVMAAEPATMTVVQPKTVSTQANAQNTKAIAKELAQQETFALLWMRSSAEYRALCYQAYNAALAQVDKALADPARKGKPLAIVLDADETVVDNTMGMGRSVAADNGRFTSPWWRDWIHEAKSGAMPGAADFLNAVQRKGVSIFYVSNRYSKINYGATARNFKALNFPSVDAEHLLLMTTTSNKQPRYDAIAEKYDIILYMGDNYGDFPIGSANRTMAERNGVIDAHQADFGMKFIVFPNPAYGSWVSALHDHYMALTPAERDAVNKTILVH